MEILKYFLLILIEQEVSMENGKRGENHIRRAQTVRNLSPNKNEDQERPSPIIAAHQEVL